MLKTLIVFIHLIATIVAIGKLLDFDFRLLRLADRPLSAQDVEDLKATKQVVSVALTVLWLSGAFFLVHGYLADAKYLTNEKLWMKVVTVATLTLNGFLMHHYAFPSLKQGVTVLALPPEARFSMLAMGAVSSVSWLYAAFLGIARPWNFMVHFNEVFALYVGLLAVAVVGAVVAMPLVTRVLRSVFPLAGAAPVCSRVQGELLVREWQGVRHEVERVGAGYYYRGERYQSLSSIAWLITGTMVDGAAFFDVAPPVAPVANSPSGLHFGPHGLSAA